MLFIDDFEISNPLGVNSSKDSICNFCYSFPCLPTEESQLDNIFYAAAVQSGDLKEYVNEKCFHFLVEELNVLEKKRIDITSSDCSQSSLYFSISSRR